MKIKMMIIAFALLFSLNNVFATKLKTITSTGTCPIGSNNNSWTASWTYNEKGQPVTGVELTATENHGKKIFQVFILNYFKCCRKCNWLYNINGRICIASKSK